MADSSEHLKLAFYGDDFTGSTDALEVLAFAGMRVALFIDSPTPSAIARVGTLDAIGMAGDSRAMSPKEMDERLPPVFDALARCGAAIVHYKVCSTFDSAKTIGSIGHAMRIARRHFGDGCIPVVGGTPALKRYCAFANLFARSATDDRIHRIDRHPIMRAHPLTPMHESDLCILLGTQGEFDVESFGFPDLEQGEEHAQSHLEALLRQQPDAVVLDATSSRHLTQVGRLLDRWASTRPPLFVVGPSGVEYALTQWWRESPSWNGAGGHFDHQGTMDIPDCVPAKAPVLAISGSASPLSSKQIESAIDGGFEGVAIDSRAMLDDERWTQSAAALVDDVIRRLQQGRSVIVHTARGPDDPRIGQGIAMLEARGRSRDDARREAGGTIGKRLGEAAKSILDRFALKRLLLSGGDTSTEIVKAIAPIALTIAARLAPGAPLCRMVSERTGLDGLEVALKGGQMGAPEFFVTATRGTT